MYAYVLIKTEVGEEQNLFNVLKEEEYVTEVSIVYGLYDLVVKIETRSVEELRDIITNKIRSMKGVRNTITLIAVDTYSIV